MEVTIEHQAPTPLEFSALRASVNWGDTNLDLAKESLKNSLFHVTARHGSKLIGMGRVIGDGVMFFYIQDLVVEPEFQHLGVGTKLMIEIENYLSKVTKKGATIALLSAEGKEPFYGRFGYLERTGSPLGKGMCKFI